MKKLLFLVFLITYLFGCGQGNKQYNILRVNEIRPLPISAGGDNVTDLTGSVRISGNLLPTGFGTSGQAVFTDGAGNWYYANSSGISYTDLSVIEAAAAGFGGLSYNNLTGQFTYTPPDLSGYLTSEVDLSYTPSTRIINNTAGDNVTLPLVTSTDAGLVPASGGGTTNFLRADNSWNSITSSVITFDSHIVPDSENLTIGSNLRSYIAGYIDNITLGSNNSLGSNRQISIRGSDTNVDLLISAKGTGNISLGGFTLDADQTIGASQDNHILTYDHSSGLIGLEPYNLTFPLVTSTDAGLAPASGGGTTNFLRADGVWTGITSSVITFNGNIIPDDDFFSVGSNSQSYIAGYFDNLILGSSNATGVSRSIEARGSSNDIDINITPKGTGSVFLGTLPFSADQTVGASQDNHILTYDHSSGLIGLESSSVSGGGISYTDLSVIEAAAAGFGGLSYNNLTGQFTYTPPDLSGYLTSEVDGSITNEIQNAGEVPFTPYSTIAATNVQSAIEELVDESSSGGDVTKVGSPVDNQIGVWTGDGTIEGTNSLRFGFIGSNHLSIDGDGVQGTAYYARRNNNFNEGYSIFGVGSSGNPLITFASPNLSAISNQIAASNITDTGTNPVFLIYTSTDISNRPFLTFRKQLSGTDLATIEADGTWDFQGNELENIGVVQMTVQGSDPTIVANSGQIYTKDVSSSAEVFVQDEAGNATQISPHNFTGIPEGRSEEMAWSFYSERNGVYVNVDMLKLARLIEEITGETLVYIGDVDSLRSTK